MHGWYGLSWSFFLDCERAFCGPSSVQYPHLTHSQVSMLSFRKSQQNTHCLTALAGLSLGHGTIFQAATE